jgi:molybdopterin-containing oxidoreductase family iron-sulfur binding subunit
MPANDTPPLAPTVPSREFWRTLDERLRPFPPTGGASDEFAAGAVQPPSALDRRDFLKLLGGTVALAGLAGCGARPRDEIVPYVTPPETHPADAEYYATVISCEGFGRGLLVKSVQGRPTKIEGNPDHPESLGATDAITQAAILSLYDPDRSRTPRQAGQPQTWEAFDQDWLARRVALQARSGRGFALLTEPTTSPSLLAAVHRLLDAWPAARWYQHTALARYDREGRQLDFDFAAADVVFSIGGDWFAQHPAALRYGRAFASRRRVEHGQIRLTRLYAVEPSPTITGTTADLRLPASPRRLRVVLDAVAAAVASTPASGGVTLTRAEAQFVHVLATDLRKAGTRALCLAGPEQPADIQDWAMALNAQLGIASNLQKVRAAFRSDGDPRSHGDLAALVAAIQRDEIDTLWVLGTNPAYTAPGHLDVAAALRRVPSSVHLGSHLDETGEACTWHLPEAHWLETWGDLRGYDGTPAVQQPLIAPLIPARSALEMVASVTDPTRRSGYDLVRDTWRAGLNAAQFEEAWTETLRRGVVATPLRANVPEPPLPSTGALAPSPPTLAATAPDETGLTLILAPDTNVLDGRFANNVWLQELPRPLSHLVWDNAALVSPALAAQHHLAQGDLIELSVAGAAKPGARPPLRIRAAVFIQPGQAADCVALALGYGRSAAGPAGNGRGFNAYLLRPRTDAWVVPGLTLSKLGGTYPLVTTQSHFAMEDRAPVRLVSDRELTSPPPEPAASLYPTWPRGEYAWAMSIDLSTCTGCNACVVACQAENNIPSVGKSQVARGREMLWLRIDRYFSGDPAAPRLVPQPVPCMQCENAPCELVCPVGATVHSTEGLNDMVYNRCVGTRYCSNNCPYKVRRFNFLDFRAPAESPLHLQENPDVTVRARGVMEKCTYCVQRINAGRIAAERENRRVRDGEIRTACQQVCPVEAIVFGDLNDPHSRVSQRKREPLDYRLLAELNTRPRTTYLARVVAAEALHLSAKAQPEAGA